MTWLIRARAPRLLLDSIRAALAEVVFHDGFILAAAGAHRVTGWGDDGGNFGSFDDVEVAEDEEFFRELGVLEEVEDGVVRGGGEEDARFVVLLEILLIN